MHMPSAVAPTDHPRLRGENALARVCPHVAHGPPPPARGEPARGALVATSKRTTPACAGRTAASRAPGRAPPDHPRLRGENRLGRPDGARLVGPPPPARGERRALQDMPDGPRTTPACAGRTCGRRTSTTARPDHPRLRGENVTRSPPCLPVPGPPPPARGERTEHRRRGSRARTTPACAGRTPRLATRPRARSDHPRLRGENVLCRPDLRVRHWTTPACAGRTSA